MKVSLSFGNHEYPKGFNYSNLARTCVSIRHQWIAATDRYDGAQLGMKCRFCDYEHTKCLLFNKALVETPLNKYQPRGSWIKYQNAKIDRLTECVKEFKEAT